ncbi:hypothetical protein F5882DRAFT_409606 [Hyaloscypha sp. PMI_1271]|nr:hypothetical protein F5882DRAFT_409606 [Hyaloscypha sp. PMI_1271]
MNPEMAVDIEKFPAWRRIQGWLRAKNRRELCNVSDHSSEDGYCSLSQSQLLLRDYYEVEVTDWAHFRASALFYSYHLIKTDVSRFVWFIAGKQLAALKCYSRRGFPPAITPGMYAMLKADAEYVRRAKANELMWDENMSVTNADEIEDLGND